MRLDGKIVLVSGANGALGRAVARRARALGAQVLELDLHFPLDPSESIEIARGRHSVDLTDSDATARCIAGLGRIDVACNVAGGFAMGPRVHEIAAADWEAMFRINVDTLLNVVRAVVPGMIAQGRGAIVNVGAVGGLRGGARTSAYSAAKGTVLRLTESLSAELREHGINVNAVLPSILDTPRNRAEMPQADVSRWVAPDDLAEVICFLGSDAARAVHGALVPVTGLS